ncbi:uncharacterized protein EI90DRAFT_3115703 [Cantharellus anzutake]|uniref:uncharacterized protein n=1 Tax=Cantharellus anzutake TaxID=1750568 RepID=UPI001903E75A|nr:uncharacterized protein EI90DRAFT_3115703 [Cantharellus anzutake]KAF8343190.1 hypothetical protein EI90DRAFT_3115703 [Cantharellus anzutake]
MGITIEQVKDIFSNLGNGNPAAFFNYVEEDVDWTVTNPDPNFKTHPLAGHYTGKNEFLEATDRINNAFQEPINLVIMQEPIVVGNRAVVEMWARDKQGDVPVGRNGIKYDNRFAWFATFNETGRICTVRAYLDSAMVRDLLQNPSIPTARQL